MIYIRKKIALSLVGIIFISLLVGCSNKDTAKVLNDYTKEKYGFEVSIISDDCYGCIGILDTTTYRVVKKDTPEFEFEIDVYNGLFDSSVTGDKYEEYHKLYEFNRSNLSAFKKLQELEYDKSYVRGFHIYSHSEKDKNGDTVNTYNRMATLYLYNQNGIEWSDTDVQNLYKALPSIKEIKKEIKNFTYELDTVVIANVDLYGTMQELDTEQRGGITYFEMAELESVTSVEDLKKIVDH